MVCGFGRSAGWVERYTCIVRCALDADVACWAAAGRLWASLRVAVVAMMGCGGFVHLGPEGLGLVCWWSLTWGCRMVFVGRCGWLPW